jgi:hypothetical protein
MTALWVAQDREPRDRRDTNGNGRSAQPRPGVSTEEAARQRIAGASPSDHRSIDDTIHRLSARFAHLPVETVAEVVNGAYARFDGSPIRDYVPLLVERAAREQLTEMSALTNLHTSAHAGSAPDTGGSKASRFGLSTGQR